MHLININPQIGAAYKINYVYLISRDAFDSNTDLEPEAYSESCLYRHIQAYSGVFDDNSHNNINFLFFHFNFTLFNEI